MEFSFATTFFTLTTVSAVVFPPPCRMTALQRGKLVVYGPRNKLCSRMKLCNQRVEAAMAENQPPVSGGLVTIIPSEKSPVRILLLPELICHAPAKSACRPVICSFLLTPGVYCVPSKCTAVIVAPQSTFLKTSHVAKLLSLGSAAGHEFLWH